MARTRAAAPAGDEPIPAPVTGTLVDAPAAIIPSSAEQAQQADRAVGRTVVQVGIPSAVVAIGTWLFRLWGIDLNPLKGQEDMPPEIVAAFIAVFTWLGARKMNPKPKN